MVDPFSKFYGKVWAERSIGFSKKWYKWFSKQPSVGEIDMFLCDNQWKISTFSILKLWNQFSGRRKPFSKNWNTIFLLKLIRLKTHHFHTKVSCQKPMLRQIESGVQNGPITKNGTLAVTALFFWKIYFILRTFFKVLILCPNYRNVQIHTFHKRWSFKWGCVFPVSILKVSLLLFYIILSIFMVLSFNMIFTELQNHVLHCKFLIFIMRKKKAQNRQEFTCFE